MAGEVCAVAADNVIIILGWNMNNERLLDFCLTLHEVLWADLLTHKHMPTGPDQESLTPCSPRGADHISQKLSSEQKTCLEFCPLYELADQLSYAKVEEF